MCLNHSARMLAAATTILALAAPAASASAIGEGGDLSGLAPAEHHAVRASRHSSSPDWELIAIAGGGAAVLVGTGVSGSRRITRRRTSADAMRTARAA